MKNMTQTTAEQQRAITTDNPRVIVIAPPGTGKTATVVERFIHDTNKFGNDSVIAISFTRKAASEISERLEQQKIKISPNFPSSGTFHSVALMILSLAEDKGLYVGPTNLAPEETTDLIISRLIAILPTDDIISTRQRAVSRSVRELTSTIERVKRSGYIPVPGGYQFVNGKTYSLVQPLPNPSCNMHARMVAYQKELERQGLLDYNDALLAATRVISNPQIRDIIMPNLKTLIVDEYQDSNGINEMMVRALSQNINLLAACDDDQSIYYWRGARQGLVHNFTKFWKNSEKIVLTKNFRSPASIRIIADNLMAPVQNRTPKTTPEERAQVTDLDKEVFIHEYHSPTPYNARANGVDQNLGLFTAQIAKNLIEKHGAEPQDIAILARKHADIANISLGLKRAEIPFRASNPDKILSVEIKHLLAWLDLLCDTNTIHAIATVTRTPPQNRKLRDYYDFAISKNQPLPEYLLERLDQKKIRSEQMSSALKRLRQYRKDALTMPVSKVLEKISTDILADFEQFMNDERESVFWAAYNRLTPIANKLMTGSFAPLLNALRTAISDDQLLAGENRVSISTIHHMKGRQAKYIILCALADNILPGTQSMATGTNSPESEEERRLVYVSYTRTQKELHLVTIKGCPSIFLQDTFRDLKMPKPTAH